MNFEEWYKNVYGTLGSDSDTYFTSVTAWNACKDNYKEKVLKLLKKFEEEHVCDVIEKIKEL
jgi:hypothetical protein